MCVCVYSIKGEQRLVITLLPRIHNREVITNVNLQDSREILDLGWGGISFSLLILSLTLSIFPEHTLSCAPFVNNPLLLSEQRLACSFLPFLPPVRRGNHSLQRNLTQGELNSTKGSRVRMQGRVRNPRQCPAGARQERLLHMCFSYLLSLVPAGKKTAADFAVTVLSTDVPPTEECERFMGDLSQTVGLPVFCINKPGNQH